MSSTMMNLCPTTASHLASATQTEETRLLEEAVNNVRQRYKKDKLPINVIDQIAQASKAEEWLEVFDRLRSGNKVLRHSGEDTVMSRLGRCAETILNFKVVGAGFAQMNQTIAAPVWGVLCATLAAFQNMLKTDQAIDTIRQRLHDWLCRHAALHNTGFKLSSHLRSILLNFNEVVVEFCFDVAAEFYNNTTKSIFKAASKQLLGDIEIFTQRLQDAARNVDEAVSLDTWCTVNAMKYGQTSTNVSPINPPPAAGQVMSIKACAYSSSKTNGCPRVVLHGIGGVGKSQIALHYAEKFDIGQVGGHYTSIFFIRCGKNNNLIYQYVLLAEKLGLLNESQLAPSNTTGVISLVKQHLSVLPSWLLIFDDVVGMAGIEDYIPDDGDGHILFTTRSNALADTLITETRGVIEVKSLKVDMGVKLVFELAGLSDTVSTEETVAAREIALFADGLPLAIEQLVLLGHLFKNRWNSALNLVKQKLAALKRETPFCTIDSELPMAAIVGTTMNILREQHRKAAELFKILLYLDTSSISPEIFYNMRRPMDEHLQRQITHDRGSKPAPPSRSQVDFPLAQKRVKFDLLDYDPFSLDWIRRLLHKDQFDRKQSALHLPRADPHCDAKMQKLWQRGKRPIRALFDTVNGINDAMKHLVHAGFARETGVPNTFWIHGRFAEIGRTLLETDSQTDHISVAHLTATMVYLTYLTPGLSDPKGLVEVFLRLLPHAIACHKHLKGYRILDHSTVGPELSDLIASTIEAGRENYKSSGEGLNDTLEAARYHRDAIVGYLAAWYRVKHTNGMTVERALNSTFEDYMREDAIGYSPSRHISNYKQFGESAPWRCVSTMKKLGSVLVDAGKYTEGIACLQTAISAMSILFGQDHIATIDTHRLLVKVHMTKGMWPNAYQAAYRMAASFLGSETPPPAMPGTVTTAERKLVVDLMKTVSGVEMIRDIGNCCLHIPGMEKEAIYMFQDELSALESLWGKESRYCYGATQRLASAHENAGDLPKRLFWCGSALSIAINSSDEYEKKMDGISASRDGKVRELDDDSVMEAIGRFQTARAEASDLEPHLDMLVSQWDASIMTWEMLRELDEMRCPSPES